MNCPVCHTKITSPIPSSGELYYDCSACLSSLLLKNGKCELLSQGEAPANPAPPTVMPAEAGIQQEGESYQETPNFEEEVAQNPEAETSQDWEAEEPPNEETQVPQIEEEDMSAEDSYVFSEQEEPEEAPQSPQEEKENFSELEEFAKQDDENQKGSYLYALTLSEINSKESKEKVLEILNDQALGLELSSSDLQKFHEKGQIQLEDMSPVHVYVILHSIMGLSVKIHWEQRHVADPKKA